MARAQSPGCGRCDARSAAVVAHERVAAALQQHRLGVSTASVDDGLTARRTVSCAHLHSSCWRCSSMRRCCFCSGVRRSQQPSGARLQPGQPVQCIRVKKLARASSSRGLSTRIGDGSGESGGDSSGGGNRSQVIGEPDRCASTCAALRSICLTTMGLRSWRWSRAWRAAWMKSCRRMLGASVATRADGTSVSIGSRKKVVSRSDAGRLGMLRCISRGDGETGRTDAKWTE